MQNMDLTTSCAYTYTVKRGDSYYLIARRLGVPLRDLLNANPDIHPARLMVGDRLCIPSCAADTPAQDPDNGNSGNTGTENGDAGVNQPAAPPEETPDEALPDIAVCPASRRAVVGEGQTVADIQIEYDKSYRTLEAANPGVDLENLTAGQTVCVPAINLPCALPASVTLGENETLESVAVRYNLPVAAILRANPCLAPDDFDAGVTVKLPQ